MTESKYSKLTPNQQSEFYFLHMLNHRDPILHNHPDYRASHYPYMLVDDLKHGVFPHTFKRNYTVKLGTKDLDIVDVTSFALNSRYYYGGENLKESLRAFMEMAIMALGFFGECVYEIVELVDPDTSKIEAFTFSFIQPWTVFKKRSRWLQYVPLEVSQERGTGQYIPLSRERLLMFRFPEQYQKNWMKRIESLAKVSDIVLPFEHPSMQNAQNNTPFNFSEHNKFREQIVAKLTSDIGWNMRKYPPDEMSEYYWFHRMLLFEKFKIELREILISTLNKGLIYIGEKLGQDVQIRVSGLPTMEQVEQAQRDLEWGARSPEKILEQFKN